MDAIHRLPPLPGAGGAQSPVSPPPAGRTVPAAEPFERILERQLESQLPFRFSAHAQARLQSRNIQLNEPQLNRLASGISAAERRGARESLVMLDNLALIVSIPNRTVVTALENTVAKGNVFTQIDSAVIV